MKDMLSSNQLWRSALISPNAPMEDALQTLDNGGLRIVMVVDAEMKLHGVMTDGDVRRALLRHIDLSTPVHQVMNKAPTTARYDDDVRARRLFVERNAHHIPLVDEQGRLVGLETFFDLLQRASRPNWVFLMAGGFGRRLGDLTKTCPKPMLRIGGKPILEKILESFIEAGFSRFYISVHFLPEVIKSHFGDGNKWGVEIRYIEENEPLGTAGALGLLPGTVDLPIIMMNGDVLTETDMNKLMDFHEEGGGAVTMCTRGYDFQVPFGVVSIEGHQVTAIVEKPLHKFFVNAGVYVVGPEVVARSAPAHHMDMPDLIKREIDQGQKVLSFPIHEYWIDIGRQADFDLASREFDRR